MKASEKLKLLTKKGKLSKTDIDEIKKITKSDFNKQLFALMKVKPPKKDD